jgi:single-strand DNA-binding protein
MTNRFQGTGNLAAAPTLKAIEVNGERRHCAELRVYFDRPVPDGTGGFEDKGGFWLNVTLWGKRAEQAARVLPKGARVLVEGDLVQHSWTDQGSGEARTRLELQASELALALQRIEHITWRSSAGGSANEAPEPSDDEAAVDSAIT